MSINDLLTFLIRASFIVLGILTLLDFLRHRDQTRLYIALTFNSLMMVNIIPMLRDISGNTETWVGAVNLIVFVAHPYLLLGVVERFRPVPIRLRRGALIGQLLCWVIIITATEATAVIGSVLLVVYFALVEGYAMVTFIRGALTSTGMLRKRLRFAGGGAGLVALVLLLLGVGVVIRPLAPFIVAPGQVAAILAAWCFYLGFVPPRWLRSTWQLAELRRFLLHMTDKQTLERESRIFDQLSQLAMQAIGGISAAVALPADTHLTLQQHPTLSGTFPANEGIMGRAMREQKAVYADTLDSLAPNDRRLMVDADARTLLVIPIIATGHTWGLLLVFLRHHSLFVEDDLSLLTLFAEQSAILLENSSLLAAQQDLLEQLAENVKQLESANQELDAFAYSVSHDLRAPLRAIDGFSRIVMESYTQELPSEGSRYLELVRTNTQKMGQLIDDLLAFSHLGRRALNKQPLAPVKLVQEVLNELRDEQAVRQIELVVADLPACQADPAMLKQVFVNLLTNAFKFTQKRESARIEVGFRADNGETVYFVKDNGAGFDEKYAHKLFGVFQRLHRADEYEGTGVGLAIVHRVIQRHGGRIWAEAEVDKGAAFYFTLEGNRVKEAASMPQREQAVAV